MNNRIEITTGIYATYVGLVRHRDGSVTVSLPEIVWRGASGSLSERKHYHISDTQIAEQIKAAFDADDLYIPGTHSTIVDALDW